MSPVRNRDRNQNNVYYNSMVQVEKINYQNKARSMTATCF